MLDRKLLRDLRRMWAQTLAIALVMASGVATFVMASGAYHSLDETRAAYYLRYHFADVFASVRRAPKSVIDRLRDVPGVSAAEPRISQLALLDVQGLAEPATARVLSLPDFTPPALNRIHLREGRLPEWGRADYDQRQRFNLIGMLNLPHGVRVGTVWTLSSGKPFDITTGRDDNGDTLANDRPAGGTRNTGQGPDYARIDARVAKSFRLPHPFEHGVDGRASFLEFSVDVFNLFNHLNPHSYIGAQTSPFFGRANGAFQARTVQVATRYRF